MNVLDADSLEIRRAGRRVASGLSFSIGKGEALILRGPNGSGKSSLLRALAGLCPLAGGRVLIDGIDLAEDPPAARSRIAYAGHLDALKPSETCRAALSFWARAFGVGPERVEAALEGFGLQGLADTPARWLSAGQKRRLGLSRLLLADRPLWLLDEPTVSLDAGSAARMADHARAHLARGGALAAATHIDLGLEGARRLDLSSAAAARPAAAGAPEEDSW